MSRAARTALAALLLAACAGPAQPGRLAAPKAPAAPAAVAPAPPAEPWVPTPPPSPAPRLASREPQAREALLPSGLRVVAVEEHTRPLVHIVLLLPRGALSDPPEALGATSLAVELVGDFHEVGKDGEKLIEERSLRRQVAERGGALGLGSSHDAAWLTVTGFARDAGTYLRQLSNAVRAPRHGARSFKERRDARLDFLEDLRTSDSAALGVVMAEAAFGAGHPYARSAIGSHAGLERFGLEDVQRHQEALLVPEGATLLVVGDVDATALLADARTAFKNWQGRALPAPVVPAGGQVRGGVGLLRRQPATTLVTCATRPLHGVRASDAALELLAAHLGEGPSSRLARALRDEGGHAYVVNASLERRRHARAFMACAPLAAGRGGEGLKAFRQVLEATRASPMGEAELAHARGLVLGDLDASWDDAGRITQAWIEALLLGQERPRPERRRAEVEAVTAEELWRAAQEVLRPEAIRWVVSGEPKVAERASREAGLGTPEALTLDR